MDKRATQSLTGRKGTVEAHPPVTAEAGAGAGRPVIERARTNDEADLREVLRAIAARIDVVLDEKVAAGGELEDVQWADRADRPRSSLVETRAADDASDLRREALTTTVLRISADGRVDVDERKRSVIDDADLDADHEAVHEAAEGAGDDAAERRAGNDAEGTAYVAAERVEGMDRHADVEDRLRAVRGRLVTRRANATAARVDRAGPRDPRVGPPAWRRPDTRTLIQRLLIGLAIVGASAVVSILIA